MQELLKRIEKIEYYHSLLMEIVRKEEYSFYRLVMERDLSQKEVEDFYSLCEDLNKKSKEQKAEGFVFFAPLFQEFTLNLHPKLQPKEVIESCIKQNLYLELMIHLNKNL
ncbi:DUF1878 family protein [Rossellomorea sp. BNER]|jgi:hypothetical protein|uniref:DUF1878 family protein n=1 Tax=Rossellomorea sp. BNER TaxID=2962031 RepID=UPI003AF27291